MRIQKYPRLRRIIAILGLLIIAGFFIGMLYILVSGQDPVKAIGLFISMTIFSVVLYVFLSYIRRHEND